MLAQGVGDSEETQRERGMLGRRSVRGGARQRRESLTADNRRRLQLRLEQRLAVRQRAPSSSARQRRV